MKDAVAQSNLTIIKSCRTCHQQARKRIRIGAGHAGSSFILRP